MFVAALRAGERLSALAWTGLALAVIGLGTLLSPGLTAPDPAGAVLMIVAGVAWGLYSLFGKGVAAPLEATASSFVYTVPLAILLSIAFMGERSIPREGLLLAVASGAVTSGIGYALWYAALRGLTAGFAATVQLSVPVLTAIGGVILLTEQLTPRLVIASAAVLYRIDSAGSGSSQPRY